MNQEENIVFKKSSLTLAVALEMIRRAEEKAAETGIAITTCIVDESGVLKAFSRMDGSPLMAVDAARKKALTAAGIGLSTGKAWYDFIKDDPILLHGIQGITDFMLLGGGLPLRHDGEVIGAIGISGGHYSQDMECAAYAIEILNS